MKFASTFWLLTFVALLPGCTPSCVSGTAAAGPPGPCHTAPLRDAEGGVIVLRGANVSADAKEADDFLPAVDEEELRSLHDDLGLNAIRLLVFWEAIEPMPGVYDDAYLEAVRGISEAAGRQGLQVIVDMHQDVYGRGFGHAGAPRWACDERLYQSFVEPDEWYMGYLEPEVKACFDQLYEQGPTREALIAAWGRLAEALRDVEAVVGYDLFNEPFWGTADRSEFDREIAPGLYRDLIDVVRDADPRPFVLVQPSPIAGFGVPSDLRRTGRERTVYAPHFYPMEVETGGAWNGDDTALRHQLGVLCSDARRLRAPLVVGEIGARRNVQGVERYLASAYEALDEGQLSAFYYSAGRGGDRSYALRAKDGTLTVQATAVARPYPRRVAGEPRRWSYSPERGLFVLHWHEDGSATGETLVALPSLAFPHGVDVVLEADAVWYMEEGELRIPQLAGRGAERRLEVRRAAVPAPAPAAVPADPPPR